jgi:hypothetical protein
LKKRSKKRLLFGVDAEPNAGQKTKVFWFFFSKKNIFVMPMAQFAPTAPPYECFRYRSLNGVNRSFRGDHSARWCNATPVRPACSFIGRIWFSSRLIVPGACHKTGSTLLW